MMRKLSVNISGFQDQREKLRGIILSRYESVSKFADLVGISRNSMYSILAGEYYPRVPVFFEIAFYLSLTPYQLLEFLPYELQDKN